MPYIIDGHNLIPHIPGINLTDLNDETALINLLQRFAAQKRTKIEVYFDQAPISQAGTQSIGMVKAHYIKAGSTADKAIINQLSKLGRKAKNWTVVSSDREILVEAKSYHCQTLSSADFAKILPLRKTQNLPASVKDSQPEISAEEIDYWLEQFGDE